MVLGQYARIDDVAVVACLARVDIDATDNTGSARLNVDAAGLVKLVGKDVFVVGQGDDELHHQHTAAGDDCAAGTPVCVFPADTFVLFVQADDIGVDLALAFVVDDDGVKVLDYAQAITAQSEVVGAVAGSTVTEIKSLLSLERRTCVCIRDSHLTDRKSVGDTSAIVVDIVNDSTLARVEGDTETPFLPLDQRFVADLERRTIRLKHIQSLEVFPHALRQKLGNVFGIGAVIEDLLGMRLSREAVALSTSGEFVDPADFTLVDVQDGDQGQRESVEIRVGISVAGVLGKDETLKVTTALIFGIKTSIRPWFDDNLESFGKFKFANGFLEQGRLLADLDKNIEFLPISRLDGNLFEQTTRLTVSKQLDVVCQ